MSKAITRKKVFSKNSRGAGSGAVIDAMYSGTYADIQTLQGNSQLQPGRRYLITDRADTGIELVALSNNTFSTKGDAGFLCADWQGEGDYSGVQSYTTFSGGSGNFTTGNTIRVNGSSSNILTVTHFIDAGGGNGTILYKSNGVSVANGDQLVEFDSTNTTATGVTASANSGTVSANLLGLWNGTKGSFDYDTGVGTPFSPGYTITENSALWSAEVLSDDGTTITFNNLDGVDIQNNDAFNNVPISAVVNGSTTYTFQPQLIDIVIWFNGTYWSMYQKVKLDNNSRVPSGNSFWEELNKSTAEGFVEQWLEVEYDFINDSVSEIREVIGNDINTITGRISSFPIHHGGFINTTLDIKVLTLYKPNFVMERVTAKSNLSLTVYEFDGNIDNSYLAEDITYSGNGTLQDTSHCYFGQGSNIRNCTQLIGMHFMPFSDVDGGGLYGLQTGTIDAGQAIVLTNDHTNESLFNLPMIP